jgi:hypothetical protein
MWFKIVNNGRGAAHNVRCDVSVDEQHLVPDEMHGANNPFRREYMGPKSTDAHCVNVGIRRYGPTKAHFHCICDEGAEAAGEVPFNVPERDDQG